MLRRKLGRDLWATKGQVLTVALVVASGVAAFVASLATYESLKRMQAEYYDAARFAHVFAAARRVPEAVAPRLLQVPGVVDAETTIVFDVLLTLDGVLEPMIGRVHALPAKGQPRINRLTLRAGRWIEPGAAELLVAESFADARELRPGSVVELLLEGRRQRLKVAGIVLSPEYILAMHPGGGDAGSFGTFWLERERMAAAFDMEGAFNRVALRLAAGLADTGAERAAIDALDRLLAPYGAVGAHGRVDQISNRALTQEIEGLMVFGLVMPSVFLAVAVFLVNVVLTRQVGAQRAQIGALKALGCDDLRIGLHYLQFVAVIVAAGALLGVALGAWLGRLLTELYMAFFYFPRLQFVVPPWAVLAAGGAVAAAALAGAAAAVARVVRLPPAEAMRPPSPPLFQPTVLERLGFGALLSPAALMVVRDLERRPLRALAGTLGIAGAVTITIAGTWWGDAIDYLLEVELRLRERQDVTVVLAAPLATAALHDLQRLPGVIAAEVDRSAPVRLRAGTVSHRTTVIGLADDARLRLLLDARLQQVELPPAGIVLNARLAQRLGVGVGDPVQAEFLLGARPTRDLPVVGLVQEAMGLLAFMDRDALNRLLGEGDAVSGARMRVDAAAREDFLRAVRETPRVAFMVELGPIIREFRETTARNILVFSAVLGAFAATIAIGVVYNNVRIALAERSWELASLRVLGMTRGEVSTLLLGEHALQLLVALPLGWLAGTWLSWAMLELMQVEIFAIPLVIDRSTYALASAIVLAAALASALIVRRRIDRLDLVAALKTRD